MKTIDYLEFWATKHCNLNCKGCSSCSPISEEWYLKPEMLKKDLNRLKYLKININNINILGGEPLLHPQITELFNIIKQIYPDCNLGILTNGLVLKQMKTEFWDVCLTNKVKLKVTCFPIFTEKDIERIEQIINQHGIEYQLTRKVKFNKILTENNSSNMEEIIQACGCNNAYNLYEGQVSRCTVPMIAELLNSKFGIHLNTDGKLNIYNATAEEIITFLSTPNQSCINCTAFPQKIVWEKAEVVPQKNDWIIGE